MRRNALLALGNRSGEVGPRELHAIALGLLDRDPQIAAAAQRATLRRDVRGSAEALAASLRAAIPDPEVAPDNDPDDEPRDP